jgi:hypothetical protein
MATLTVTIPAGSYPAEVLRQAARRLEPGPASRLMFVPDDIWVNVLLAVVDSKLQQTKPADRDAFEARMEPMAWLDEEAHPTT